jgi:hypothetical protein
LGAKGGLLDERDDEMRRVRGVRNENEDENKNR